MTGTSGTITQGVETCCTYFEAASLEAEEVNVGYRSSVELGTGGANLVGSMNLGVYEASENSFTAQGDVYLSLIHI